MTDNNTSIQNSAMPSTGDSTTGNTPIMEHSSAAVVERARNRSLLCTTQTGSANSDGLSKEPDSTKNPIKCPICKEEAEQLIAIKPCKHEYCNECIHSWHRQTSCRPGAGRSSCPLCRKTIEKIGDESVNDSQNILEEGQFAVLLDIIYDYDSGPDPDPDSDGADHGADGVLTRENWVSRAPLGEVTFQHTFVVDPTVDLNSQYTPTPPTYSDSEAVGYMEVDAAFLGAPPHPSGLDFHGGEADGTVQEAGLPAPRAD